MEGDLAITVEVWLTGRLVSCTNLEDHTDRHWSTVRLVPNPKFVLVADYVTRTWNIVGPNTTCTSRCLVGWNVHRTELLSTRRNGGKRVRETQRPGHGGSDEQGSRTELGEGECGHVVLICLWHVVGLGQKLNREENKKSFEFCDRFLYNFRHIFRFFQVYLFPALYLF